MTEFSDISTNSEGGQAIDRLTAEFGISAQEANAAVEALMPAVAAAIKTKASEPAGFLSLLGVQGPGQPLAAVGESTALPIPDAERDAIVARAAALTGLAPSLLRKMLPVIGSLVAGAIMNAIQKRGVGGILGDLAKVAGAGGLGAILGQVLGGRRAEASPVPPQESPSGPGGIDLGTILEQVLRGGQGQASPVPPQGSGSGAGGIDLGAILEQILRGGQGQASPVPPRGSGSAPEGGIDLGTILGQILRGGQASRALPGEPERSQGTLDDEIGKILRGTHD